MTIIDNNQAKELAREEAKEQIKCQHIFEARYIELLNETIFICIKCDINKKLYDLSLSTQCYSKYKWYSKTCWTCPLSLICQIQKAGETIK